METSHRYLSQEQIIECGGLDMAEAVRDIEEVFRLFEAGDYVLPSKVVLRWGDVDTEVTRGRINALPGHIGGRFDTSGIKWMASMPGNLSLGLPRASGLLILNDPQIGLPKAIMDGTLISAMRTGAVSGVAAKYLAGEGAKVVGILGTGVQSRTQVMALAEVLPSFKSVVVYDILRDRALSWCEEMRSTVEASYEVADDAEQVCRSSDVLVAATTSSSPVVKKGWLREGCLHLQLGGHEYEVAAIKEFDRLIVDNWIETKHRGAQSLVYALKEDAISDDEVSELGQIVAGKDRGRTQDSERIFFSSVGMGIEDVAVGARILQRAEELNVGTVLELWQAPAFA